MAERTDPLRMAEALAARLCHDLAGPLGSLSQALELATADMVSGSEAFALVRHAAADMTRRLRWRRAAWSADGPEIDLPGLRMLVAPPRTDLDLRGLASDTVFAPPMARALLNVLLLATESLPSGGRIALSGAADDIVIAIDGPGAAWPPSLSHCLADADAALAITDPRTLQAPLTVLISRGLDLRLSMLLGAGPGAPPLRLSEP